MRDSQRSDNSHDIPLSKIKQNVSDLESIEERKSQISVKELSADKVLETSCLVSITESTDDGRGLIRLDSTKELTFREILRQLSKN